MSKLLEKTMIKQNSAKFKILRYLSDKDWVHAGEIEKACSFQSWGYKPSTIDRACRLLKTDGLILKRENNKGHKSYKLNPELPNSIKYKLGILEGADMARFGQ